MALQVPAKRGYVPSDPHGREINGQSAVSPEHLVQQQSSVKVYPYQRAEVTPSRNLPTPPPSDSQDTKKRRLNGTSVCLPEREAYSETMYSFAHSPIPNIAYTRPEALPQVYASQMPMQYTQGTQGNQQAIISLPQALYRYHHHPQPVRMPPAMVSQTPPKVGSAHSQSSSVEAVIMSLPVLDKIKALSRISRPLQAPGISATKSGLRGAIIAIEGMDATSVNSMTSFLTERLQKEGKFAVRIFDGPDLYSGSSHASRREAMTTETYLRIMNEWHKINKEMVEYITTGPGYELGKTIPGSRSSPIPIDDNDQDHQMSGLSRPKTPEKTTQLNEQSEASSGFTYFAKDTSTIVDSTQPPVLTFPRPLNSTRIPPPPSTSSPTSQSSPKSRIPPPPPSTSSPTSQSSPKSRIPPPPPSTSSPTSPSSPKSRIPPPPPANDLSQSLKSQATTTSTEQHPKESEPVHPTSHAIPIALVPRFQLTTVDTSSMLMSTSDGFSPVAHWEWFATLWRGTVGPDITIVIKGLDNESGVGEAARTTTGSGAAAASLNDSRDKSSSRCVRSGSHSGVKIRLNDYRALIVRSGLASSSLSSIVDADGKTANVTSATPMNPVQQAKEMGNWERAKRRVGFEVEEFLRA